MSVFRVEFDGSFNTEEDAISFLNLLQSIKGKLHKGRGDEEIPIISQCRYHECFHDEIPPKPCGNYVNFDLKDDKVEDVKTGKGVSVSAQEITKEKKDE